MNSEPSPGRNISNPPISVSQAEKSTAPAAGSIDTEPAVEQKRVLVNRIILLALLVAVLFVFVPMLRIFFTPLLLACAFASMFFPFYKVLLKFFRGNCTIGALSCCLILVLGIVIPVYFLGYLLIHQLFTFYQSIVPTVQAFVHGDNGSILAHLKENRLFVAFTRIDTNWQSTMLDAMKTAGATIEKLVDKTSRGALKIIASLFMTLFIMFYLFIDGERIVTKFRRLLPLHAVYQDMIINRFLLVSRATVKGMLVIAFVQGSLGAIILLVFGVKSWLLWGVVMIALALIPMMGGWPVLIPAGIIKMATGHVWQGIVIIALSLFVISTIDNILRPLLVGRSARMHDLLIFFSTIGGLALFGPVGIITGPVIMAFFLSITEIYAIELKAHLGETDRL